MEIDTSTRNCMEIGNEDRTKQGTRRKERLKNHSKDDWNNEY